ncbi:hypothetical protein DPMN_070664 [Dreissena polymorpha]|uniref:Uncharacterized protein n=1 Tax=Dreissena polymorpha TaxID=45954 RepID=A0A9D3Z1R6_DREPO|nr:hypothetical protein DPMN_070664 [Dreissena polymorpha]
MDGDAILVLTDLTYPEHCTLAFVTRNSCESHPEHGYEHPRTPGCSRCEPCYPVCSPVCSPVCNPVCSSMFNLAASMFSPVLSDDKRAMKPYQASILDLGVLAVTAYVMYAET